MLGETDIKNIYKKKDGEEDTNQVALVSDTKKRLEQDQSVNWKNWKKIAVTQQRNQVSTPKTKQNKLWNRWKDCGNWPHVFDSKWNWLVGLMF